ncbi:MAG: ABC transporter substrate-binding protein [Campylobacterales bacterium]
MGFAVRLRVLAIALGLGLPFAAAAKPMAVEVQLRWYHQFQFAGYYIALHKGYYQRAGLEVTLKEGSLEISPVDEVLAKRAHFGVAGPNLVGEYLKGKPVVLLAPVFQHTPNALMLLPSRGYERPADLATGAPVVTLGGSEDVDLKSIFLNEGIPLSAVRFKNEGDLGDLLKGRIAALNIYTSNEPFLMQMRGLEYRLLKPQSFGLDFYGDLFFTAQWMIDAHPQAVKAFREATLEGWRYAFAHPDETVDLILQHYRPPGKSREHLLFEAAELTRLTQPDLIDVGHNNPGRWAAIAKVFTEFKVAPGTRPLEDFFYRPDASGSGKLAIALIAAAIGALGFLLFQFRLQRAVKSETQGRKLSEESYKTLFENSPEGVCIISTEGVLKQCNPAASRMLGYHPGELIGKSVIELSPDIQPDTGFFSDNAAQMFLRKAAAGEVQHFEWTHLTRAGKEVPVGILIAPFGPADRRELLVLWRDNTELKRLQQEKQLQQAVLIQQTKLAELGSMIGAIAHQWKQPLNAIALTAQDLPDALEAGELDAAALQKRADRIMDQVRFMSQTIDDFRDFYKPSTKAAPFSPYAAVSEVCELLRMQLMRHHVSVGIEGRSDLNATGYAGEFKQVALNLINNARDAAESQGLKNCRVTVRIGLEDDRVRITFEDDAGGIPEKLLPAKLFEPFISTKGEQGTGIGLSISRTIIEEKMHGRLSAENTPTGAKFTIELPYLKELL